MPSAAAHATAPRRSILGRLLVASGFAGTVWDYEPRSRRYSSSTIIPMLRAGTAALIANEPNIVLVGEAANGLEGSSSSAPSAPT